MLLEGVTGLAVGIAARYLIPNGTGLGADTLLGILGALTGAYIYKLFGNKPPFYDFNGWSVLCAAFGALVLILVVRSAGGRRTIA